MPDWSKTSVLTSDSAPWAGISWPFQRKVTPAALPTLATIWRVARMEVWAGAMRVSWLAGCPSAVTDIQEVSVARMTRVKDVAAAVGVVGFDGGKVRTITSLSFVASSLLSSSSLGSLFASAVGVGGFGGAGVV